MHVLAMLVDGENVSPATWHVGTTSKPESVLSHGIPRYWRPPSRSSISRHPQQPSP